MNLWRKVHNNKHGNLSSLSFLFSITVVTEHGEISYMNSMLISVFFRCPLFDKWKERLHLCEKILLRVKIIDNDWNLLPQGLFHVQCRFQLGAY